MTALDRPALEAYVRQELRRRLMPSLLRLASMPGNPDLATVVVDIILTMTEKESHEQT